MFRLKTIVPVLVASAVGIALWVLPHGPDAKTAGGEHAGLREAALKVPLHFIRNEGRFAGDVLFYQRSGPLGMRFTRQGVDMALRADDKSLTTRMSFVDGASEPVVAGEGPLPGKVNHLLGADPGRWRTNIPAYRAVAYRAVYDGIDVRFYGRMSQVEYDVVVAPGADPEAVRLAMTGIEGLSVTEEGDLAVALPDGTLLQKRPVIYQEINGRRTPVEGGYRVFDDRTYGFQLAAYDRERTVVIDPVLEYSTYLGGSGWDAGWAVALGSDGSLYLAGESYPDGLSNDFPTQSPVLTEGGFSDVFVSKFNAAGDTLLFSTLMGGSGFEAAWDLAVDSSDDVYVVGYTDSSNFPTTAGAAQTANAGLTDAFVAKLSAAGDALLYATYLGGTANDEALGVAVNAGGSAFVTGYTESDDFPTAGAFQGSHGGGYYDAFISVVAPGGGSVTFSSYAGGNDDDEGAGIDLDAAGNVYLTGTTASTDFPVLNALQPLYGGGLYDAFVMKLNSAGDPVYATYLGGGDWDEAAALAASDSGDVYLAGTTFSTDFPTANPLQAVNAGLNDGFVARVNAAGDTLVYSTYLGGSDDDVALGIAVDAVGSAYVTGDTYSTDFPTMNAVQPGHAGFLDAFGARLSAAGDALLYATFLGGSDEDTGTAVSVTDSGDAYFTGYTYSSDFSTASPLQAAAAGWDDAYLVKIALTGPTPDVAANGSNGPVSIGSSETLTVTCMLNANDLAGTAADWWVVASTPMGWYRYNAGSGTWVPGVAPTFRGELFNLAPTQVLNMSGLPAGAYTFHFGVDLAANGALDMDQMHSDSVDVTVTP